MTAAPDPAADPEAERAERRRRRAVAFWSAATVVCGALWIPTRNGLFLVGALLYGATAVVLARRLRGSAAGTSVSSRASPPPSRPRSGRRS